MTIHRPGKYTSSPPPEKTTEVPPPRLIAVIDDDALVLEATGALLTSWGYRVLTANSDRVALARIGEHKRRPDLIISDYRLSKGRTGIDVIAQLRAALAAPIPAVIISGDTLPICASFARAAITCSTSPWRRRRCAASSKSCCTSRMPHRAHDSSQGITESPHVT
jgi:CheY-like chemotaxis protein